MDMKYVAIGLRPEILSTPKRCRHFHLWMVIVVAVVKRHNYTFRFVRRWCMSQSGNFDWQNDDYINTNFWSFPMFRQPQNAPYMNGSKPQSWLNYEEKFFAFIIWEIHHFMANPIYGHLRVPNFETRLHGPEKNRKKHWVLVFLVSVILFSRRMEMDFSFLAWTLPSFYALSSGAQSWSIALNQHPRSRLAQSWESPKTRRGRITHRRRVKSLWPSKRRAYQQSWKKSIIYKPQEFWDISNGWIQQARLGSRSLSSKEVEYKRTVTTW